MSNKIKLNLGSGFKKLEDFINIDSSGHCSPDLILDIIQCPWPFDSDSVDYVLMESVLEHLPIDPGRFFLILQEIYRVSCAGAIIEIECPYPNHRWQLVDFTHQRAIHPEGLQLLDRQYCEGLIEKRSTKTPLAVIYDIDFELVEYRCDIDRRSVSHIERVLGKYDPALNESYNFLFNNVGSTQRFKLCVRK